MTQTVFVVDDEILDAGLLENAIAFDAYLKTYPRKGEGAVRVINLCNIDRYLSRGYYCSLLAEARHHKVVPGVRIINSLRGDGASIWLEGKEAEALQDGEAFIVCMGQAVRESLASLAARVFRDFPAPLLCLTATREHSGVRLRVQCTSLDRLDSVERERCAGVLAQMAEKQWRRNAPSRAHRWDMALLLDSSEQVPPSNHGAIKRFVKAGKKLGIRVKTFSAATLPDLDQFDALFLRETTAIDHHSYRIAQEAESRGLVVMDDPNSILRCCNKVFLHDAFHYSGVGALKTLIISESDLAADTVISTLGLPFVLKMPEGSFSRGVFRIETVEEFRRVARELFESSALLLAQEFLFTPFDWRIGVLNGRALYACRYYMARNHWQIYNHGAKRNFSGGFDALPTFEVPGFVLKAALKAAAVVGNGLYGVDIKAHEGRAYVLEVNDNPSIDHGVEDAYLGDELYMQIMSEFLRRLELRGRSAR
jgi:glutathione synthase/RimK-type ligase-like ATP-grasp enzyme